MIGGSVGRSVKKYTKFSDVKMGVLNDIPFLTNHNGATRDVLIGSDVRTQRNAVRKTKTLNGYILVNFNSNWTNDPSFPNFFSSPRQP